MSEVLDPTLEKDKTDNGNGDKLIHIAPYGSFKRNGGTTIAYCGKKLTRSLGEISGSSVIDHDYCVVCVDLAWSSNA